MLIDKYEGRRNWFTQGRIISYGFILLILTGAVLLMLPFASRDGSWTSFWDTLFTATSATCVTGLVVVDTYTHWSVFGQLIILCLIQIGGLGFVTIGVILSIVLRRRIGLRIRGLMQESVSALQIGGIIKLVKMICIGTAFIEGLGAVLLSFRFIPQFGVLKGIYFSIFHAVSAFCNAGFDLLGGREQYCSMVYYYDDVLVNVVIMALIVIGGLGFIVWADLKEHKLNFKKYRLHTKLVLVTTAFLIIVPAIMFYFTERDGVMAGMGVKGKILSSLFASITPRTAGFNTIDVGNMSSCGKFLTMMLMFVGGSPGSTAGGIKTVTLIVLLLGIKSMILHEDGSEIFGRRIDDESVKKAGIVFNLNLFLSLGAAFIIMYLEPLKFEDILFEVFSAMGTAGITTGITRSLCLGSKLVLVFLMYCGRVGSLSFALSFTSRKQDKQLRKPTERITIG